MGNAQWIKSYGSNNEGRSVQQLSDGGYIVVGSITNPLYGTQDVWLLRLNSIGDTLWTKKFGGIADDMGYDVKVTRDGGYIITGFTNSYGSGYSDVYLIKTDSSGSVLWTITLGGQSFDESYSIQQTKDGGYIVAGFSNTPSNCGVYLIKINSVKLLSPDGGELWQGGSTHNIRWRCEDTSIVHHYRLLYSRNSGTTYTDTIAYYISNVDTTYLWVLPALNLSTVKVKIQSLNASGFVISEDASNSNFTIRTQPTITSPNGGEVWAGGSTHPITWSVIGQGFAGYRLLFSTDGGTSYQDTLITGLSPDSVRWYWRLPDIKCATCRIKIQILDSLNGVVSEDVSNNNFAIIDTIPPQAFSLISPPDSTAISVTRPTIIWQASYDSASGLKNYNIFINNSLKHTGSDTLWTVNYDLPEGYHNWYIVVYDSADNSRMSNEIWNFVVDTTPPPSPVLISPSNNTFINNNLVTLIWHKANDNLSGIDHYFLQIALDSNFTQGLVETTLVDTSITGTFSDTVYCWRVKAVDKAGNECNFSPTWQFTIDTYSPPVPSLIAPINNSYLTDTVIIFEWSAVTKLEARETGGRASPVLYILQIDTSINFTNPIIVDTTRFTKDTFNLTENRYFWRVRAYDLAGNQGNFSLPWNFYIRLTEFEPNIRLSAYQNNFGNVETNKSAEWLLMIWNTGNIRLSLDSIKSSTEIFTVTSLTYPKIIAPGDSVFAKITFTPRAAKTYTGVINIYSDDPDSSVIQVSLMGSGEIGETTVYPNPYVPAMGHKYLHFSNVPINGKIEVFNLAGEKLWECTSDIDGTLQWNTKTKSGKLLSTDCYYYIIKNEKGTIVKKGKFSVIR
ncbi:MAG: choice-of-anchor D domain-containing protein [candidate division WOR-3 bacterium]|nr:choice-of-anchor D domain-containing protein [candidate division WOR-3 bacterium]